MKLFTKTEAKEKIKALVKKFESLSKQTLRNYNEANTRKDFILPLFQALSWDVKNDFIDNEVVEEESTISGRIDYSFRINNITQFLLEAKAIPEDLDKEKWAKQAIEYGWNKGIPWVVLTDFEGLKVFNSEWRREQPRANIDLSYKDYLDKFDKLWLLSKESFETNELDKLLSEFGITAKRVNVNEKLAADLVKWRNILTNNLKQWNRNYDESEIGEAIQRILDRLIFIRVVEDRNIEDKLLWQAYQKWNSGSQRNENFLKTLFPIFKDFDKKYNSNLFQKHLCEKLETEGEPFRQIIPQLYGEKEKGVKYRFDAIDADVLGNVYEQYLGAVQQREGNKSKRKKQGIYYTPAYIVDYIVQNTVAKLLEKTPSLANKENIKILDPACGSGSFLIKAFEVTDEHLRKIVDHGPKDPTQTALRKYKVLTQNIYGVDLDEQAIEIARLNLLLKALVPEQKLPMLTDHMKVGNSLISDKKIADKAFDWKKEFPDVFKGKNPGFDVIIGNPPYVGWAKGKQSRAEKDYYEKKYKEIYSGKADLFYYFIQQSIRLLKKRGRLSFIVSRYFLESIHARKLRKYILDKTRIISLIDFREKRVFADAGVHTCIFVLEKKSSGKNNIRVHLNDFFNKPFYLSQNNLRKAHIWQLQKPKYLAIVQKIIGHGEPITKYLDIKDTALSALDKVYVVDNKFVEENRLESLLLRNFIRSKDIKEKFYYQIPRAKLIHIDKNTDLSKYPNLNSYILKNKKLILERNKRRGENLGLGLARPMRDYPWNDPKLLCPSRAIENLFVYDTNGAIGSRHNTTVLFNKSKVDIRYFLGLLNSRLFEFYFQSISKKMGKSYEYLPKYLNELFVRIGSQKTIVDFVKQLIRLKKQLYEISKHTNKWQKLKNEAEKLDRKIDKEAYKLYGLTPKEIDIVEKSTK